jgi:hypothetical protein
MNMFLNQPQQTQTDPFAGMNDEQAISRFLDSQKVMRLMFQVISPALCLFLVWSKLIHGKSSEFVTKFMLYAVSILSLAVLAFAAKVRRDALTALSKLDGRDQKIATVAKSSMPIMAMCTSLAFFGVQIQRLTVPAVWPYALIGLSVVSGFTLLPSKNTWLEALRRRV